MNRLFDFSFATSTPEAVAIWWHGVITAAPLLLGVALTAGSVFYRWRQARVAEADRLRAMFAREQAQRRLAKVYARLVAADGAPSLALREEVRAAEEAARTLDEAPR